MNRIKVYDEARYVYDIGNDVFFDKENETILITGIFADNEDFEELELDAGDDCSEVYQITNKFSVEEFEDILKEIKEASNKCIHCGKNIPEINECCGNCFVAKTRGEI